jgi:putative Holliday junction resolvase
MPKIIAIDYGKKRTGIAATDDLQMIASGVTTVSTPELVAWLTDYFSKNKVETVIIGDPIDLKGNPAESAPLVHKFIQQFEKRFPDLPLVRVDERFTSKMAFQTMIDSGLKKKARRNKALIDEISATIMLQSYLSLKSRTA